MKLKSLAEMIGFRKKARNSEYTTRTFPLSGGKTVYFAKRLVNKNCNFTISDEVIDSFREYISEGDFCIDIGASRGDSTLPMAIAAGTTGCALAIEPNRYVYHALERNARSNRHLCNIQSIMAAASDQEGFLTFNYSDPAFINGGEHRGISKLKHGHMYKLEVFAIDLAKELEECYSDWLPKLKFIKVDAEGNDLHILKSLESIIRTYKPALKCEVFKRTSAEYRQELIHFLGDLGYSARRIINEPIEPGPELNPKNMSEFRHFDILAVA
jgi:FkbM family methyltransferase